MQKDPCASCGKACWLYCSFCLLPTHPDAPKGIRLPKKLVIFKDPKEKRSKSTALHAPILCPNDSLLIESKSLQLEDCDPSRTLLLFPSNDAKEIQEIEFNSFDQIIVIDGTWSQAKSMASKISNRFKRHVQINQTPTMFWRYQRFDSSYLATIEAIYWLYRNMTKTYEGEYEGLLFFFTKQYQLIQDYYKSNPQRKFISKKLDADTYIRYDE